MRNTKIKISAITNLTDARYFAAAEVDYLGFCCDEESEFYCSSSKIKEIMNWVEGPQCILEFSGYQSQEEIKALIESVPCSGLHFGIMGNTDDHYNLPVFRDYIFQGNEINIDNNDDIAVIKSEISFENLNKSEIAALKNMLPEKNCYLDINFQAESFRQLTEELNVYGLILRGGPEERTGIKSFDQLDIILDI
ncbi:MAG: hypothetical protein IPM42_13650 [Saprospiraceae bacterium]|nr:hypothetical protein [Saprospiraceae bacterium]